MSIYCGAGIYGKICATCYKSTGLQTIEELSICFSYVKSRFIISSNTLQPPKTSLDSTGVGERDREKKLLVYRLFATLLSPSKILRPFPARYCSYARVQGQKKSAGEISSFISFAPGGE
jgi:hypothetical protein